MLLNILNEPKERIKDFISVAELLVLVDQPLKSSVAWEDMGANDVSELELDLGGIVDGTSAVPRGSWPFPYGEQGTKAFNPYRLRREVEKAIKELPFKKIINPHDGHREAFRKVLKEIIDEFKSEKNIQTSRTITLWLLLLALDVGKGDISPNRLALVDDFRQTFEVENDVFEDLQERAAALHKELTLTMTILVE